MDGAPTFRRCALLCAILGAHLLLFSLISVNDSPRSARRSEEPPGILFFVDLPKPDDTKPSTLSTLSYEPSLESRAAPDNAGHPASRDRGDRGLHRLGHGSQPSGWRCRQASGEEKNFARWILTQPEWAHHPRNLQSISGAIANTSRVVRSSPGPVRVVTTQI